MWIPTVRDIDSVVKQPAGLLTVKDNSTVEQAATIMRANYIGCLVVLDGCDRFCGIVSERDMLSKVLTGSAPPSAVLVKDIMTSNPISATLDTPIGTVEQLMADHKIRHIPVVAGDRPIGMVSSRDIIAYRLASSRAMKTAAEQLAMLSTSLKSLDIGDVVTMAINDVPRNCQASRAVLYFPQMADLPEIVHHNGCVLSSDQLHQRLSAGNFTRNRPVICDKLWSGCEQMGGQPPGLIIPLTICEQPAELDRDCPTRSGFLCMCQIQTTQMFSECLLYKASLLSELLSVNFTNARLYQNYLQARLDSETDPLTRVSTRRVLDQMLTAEYARAVRYDRSFALAIIDIDNFKQINDSAGHAAGDKVLRKLCNIMRRSIRKSDCLTRYGGDEFVLLMPETRADEAIILLERLRRQARSISIPEAKSVSISISCGVAHWQGSASDTVEQILKRADAALYQAKRAGRNRVVASGQTAGAATEPA